MSDMVKEYFESTFERPQSDGVRFSAEAPSTGGSDDNQNQMSDPSIYTLACDQSQMSRDVDLWLRETTASTGIQLSRVPLTQRATSANIPSGLNSNGMWYVLALLLPFFSVNNYPQWRCSPSNILNTAELLITQIGRTCDRLRSNIRRIAQFQISREFIATIMDVLLVIYAIGFLVLSMYQAAIIG